MANDLNLCHFIGRLGRDPEMRYMPGGDAVANLSIAVGKSWKTKSGEKEDRVTWVNIVAFRQLAEIMGKYLSKGSMIYVSGELQVRRWEDKEGNTRYTTEIVANQMQMLGGRGDTAREPERPGTDFNVDEFPDDDLAF